MSVEVNLPAEFLSGNSIPVERATISRARMIEILEKAILEDREAQKRNVKKNWDSFFSDVERELAEQNNFDIKRVTDFDQSKNKL